MTANASTTRTFIDRLLTSPLRTAAHGLAAGALGLGLLGGAAASAQTPLLVGYQGALFDAQGQPAQGAADVDVAIFDAAQGGARLYAESHTGVPLVDGTFDVQIGSGTSPSGVFDEQTFAGPEAWLELTVDGEVLTPRQRLVAVPYALRAKVAESLDGSIGTVPHALTADSLTGVTNSQVARADLLGVNVDASSQPSSDGIRLFFDGSFYGSGKDAFVIEKTDTNGSNPDGSIVFANRGSDGVSETSLRIDGDGNVGIPVVNPSARVHIEATGQRGMNVWTNNSQKSLEVSNVGTGEALVAAANGQGRQRAVVRVRADNPNDGVAGYFYSDSTAGTMYLENMGSGQSLVLENTGGNDIIQAWDWSDGSATAKRFWVDPNGVTNVRTLRIHGGADLSEQFAVRVPEGSSAEPGTVVSIDPENLGGLVVSDRAYDKRVAGIVAGAGGVRPGLLLEQAGRKEASGQVPVALSGRVYVKADTSAGVIEPGDLLTTSSRPGRAMRVDDGDAADGAILGKAMGPVNPATGLVLVLVNLH